VKSVVRHSARLSSGAPAAGGGVAAETTGQVADQGRSGDSKGEYMKALSWIGLVVLILGIVSFFVPIPRSERQGIKAGGVTFGVETRHEEKVPPFVGAVMILGGVGLLVAGKMRS